MKYKRTSVIACYSLCVTDISSFRMKQNVNEGSTAREVIVPQAAGDISAGVPPLGLASGGEPRLAAQLHIET